MEQAEPAPENDMASISQLPIYTSYAFLGHTGDSGSWLDTVHVPASAAGQSAVTESLQPSSQEQVLGASLSDSTIKLGTSTTTSGASVQLHILQHARYNSNSSGSQALQAIAAPHAAAIPSMQAAVAALAGNTALRQPIATGDTAATATLQDSLSRLRQDINSSYTSICTAKGLPPPTLVNGRLPAAASAATAAAAGQLVSLNSIPAANPAAAGGQTNRELLAIGASTTDSALWIQSKSAGGFRKCIEPQANTVLVPAGWSNSMQQLTQLTHDGSSKKDVQLASPSAAAAQFKSAAQIRQQFQNACSSLTASQHQLTKGFQPLEVPNYRRKHNIVQPDDLP